MNKYDDDDFNVSDFERKLQRRHKRLLAAISVVAIIAFIGMLIFWK